MRAVRKIDRHHAENEGEHAMLHVIVNFAESRRDETSSFGLDTQRPASIQSETFANSVPRELIYTRNGSPPAYLSCNKPLLLAIKRALHQHRRHDLPRNHRRPLRARRTCLRPACIKGQWVGPERRLHQFKWSKGILRVCIAVTLGSPTLLAGRHEVPSYRLSSPRSI